MICFIDLWSNSCGRILIWTFIFSFKIYALNLVFKIMISTHRSNCLFLDKFLKKPTFGLFSLCLNISSYLNLLWTIFVAIELIYLLNLWSIMPYYGRPETFFHMHILTFNSILPIKYFWIINHRILTAAKAFAITIQTGASLINPHKFRDTFQLFLRALIHFGGVIDPNT